MEAAYRQLPIHPEDNPIHPEDRKGNRFFWLLVCCFLVCLFAFVVWFVLVFLLGLHTGLRTGPLPVLLWLSTN